MRQSVTPLLLVSLGLAGTAEAAGFAVDTQSARATGMAAAVTGSIDDASAIFYNPAGIANGRDLDVQIGATMILPNNVYEPPGGGTATNGTQGPVVPPTIYASTSLLKPLALGIGLYSPYGLALTWPNPWAGQYLVTHSELSTFFINPTVAMSLAGTLRIAVGLDIVRGTVKLNQNINYVDSTGTLELGGDAWGTGFNVGIQADILPDVLSAGLTYRGTVSLPFAGNAHFGDVPPSFQSQVTDATVTTTVVLPQSAQLGVTLHTSKTLSLGADLVYTGWQSIRSLDLVFSNPALNTTQPRDWTHTFNYHFGAEWTPADAWRVRLGFMYDPSPIPGSTLSPDLPDTNRYNIAVGGGYRIAGFTFDLGYQYIILTTGDSTYPKFPPLPAQYHGNANLLALTIGYQMGSQEPAPAAQEAPVNPPPPTTPPPAAPASTTPAPPPPAH